MEDTPKREMPRYRCHKIVYALKIGTVKVHADASAAIAPNDKGVAPFTTKPNWADRFHGSENDLGYYVVYDDGYTSWSPAKAFEDGYTLVE